MVIRIIMIALALVFLIVSIHEFYKVYHKYEADKSPYKDHMEYCFTMLLYMFVCMVTAGAIFLFMLDIICM